MNGILLSLILSIVGAQVVGCTGPSRERQQAETPKQLQQNTEQQDGESAENGTTPTGSDPQTTQNPSTPAEPAAGSAETSQPKPTEPSPEALSILQERYNAELNSIIDSRCQICHGSIKELNFSNFERVKADAAQMADAVSKGRMPGDPSMLPAEEKEKLISFLTQLAQLPR